MWRAFTLVKEVHVSANGTKTDSNDTKASDSSDDESEDTEEDATTLSQTGDMLPTLALSLAAAAVAGAGALFVARRRQ